MQMRENSDKKRKGRRNSALESAKKKKSENGKTIGKGQCFVLLGKRLMIGCNPKKP